MGRFSLLTALVLSASVAAQAQDTTVVVIRHLPAAQDTGVTVRHIAPAPLRRAAPPGAPYAASPYSARNLRIAKDPGLGTALSLFFPGGGQYYAGATSKGTILTLLGIGAPIIGYANVTREYRPDFGVAPGTPCETSGSGFRQTSNCRWHYDWTPAAVGLGVGITAWLYGVATAGTDVQHWNQAHGVRFVTAPGRVGFAVAVP